MATLANEVVSLGHGGTSDNFCALGGSCTDLGVMAAHTVAAAGRLYLAVYMKIFVDDLTGSVDNRAVAAAAGGCGSLAVVRCGNTAWRIAVASGTGIGRIGVIDHGRVVPVRFGIGTAGSAVFKTVAVTVDAGAGGRLAGNAVGVAGKGRKLRRR